MKLSRHPRLDCWRFSLGPLHVAFDGRPWWPRHVAFWWQR